MATNVSYATLFDFCDEIKVEGLYNVTFSNGETLSIFVRILSKLEGENYLASYVTGSVTTDGPMLLVKADTLIIPAGTTLTPPNRCKGLTVFCKSLVNNGIISMTAKGSNAIGQNVLLYRNIDNSLEFIPAVGAAGAPSRVNVTGSNVTTNVAPNGSKGINRATGGGGGGGATNTSYVSSGVYGGAGGVGTSYSGGAGGGGGNHGWDGNSNAVLWNGGAAYGVNGGNYSNPGVGITNRGGSGSYTTNQATGTGGLLIVFSESIFNNGIISADGVSSVIPTSGGGSRTAGGASGGGSVNIFFQEFPIKGTITANGGIGATWTGDRWNKAGNGGNGCVNLSQISFFKNFIKDGDLIFSYLNYKLHLIKTLSFDTFSKDSFSDLNSLLYPVSTVPYVLDENVKLEQGSEYRSLIKFSLFKNIKGMEVHLE